MLIAVQHLVYLLLDNKGVVLVLNLTFCRRLGFRGGISACAGEPDDRVLS